MLSPAAIAAAFKGSMKRLLGEGLPWSNSVGFIEKNGGGGGGAYCKLFKLFECIK